MEKYVCKNCGNTIEEDVVFCPYCGLDIANKKETIEDKRKLIKLILLIASIVFVVAVVLVLAVSLINSMNLKNSAAQSRENVNLELSAEAVNGANADMGNLTENILADGYLCEGNNVVYIAKDNGIYALEEDELSKLQSGSFKGLNYFSNKLYAINIDQNSICIIKDKYSEIYKPEASKKITNMAINNGFAYVILNDSSNIELVQISLNSKEAKSVRVFNGSKCWMYVNSGVMKLCIQNAMTWCVYQSYLDELGNCVFSETVRGTNNISEMAFVDNKIVIFENNKRSYFVFDNAGNRKEIAYELDEIQNILVSGHTIFLYTKSERFYRLNENTGITHEFTDDINLGELKASSTGIEHSRLYVICGNDAIKLCDFGENTFTEIQ